MKIKKVLALALSAALSVTTLFAEMPASIAWAAESAAEDKVIYSTETVLDSENPVILNKGTDFLESDFSDYEYLKISFKYTEEQLTDVTYNELYNAIAFGFAADEEEAETTTESWIAGYGNAEADKEYSITFDLTQMLPSSLIAEDAMLFYAKQSQSTATLTSITLLNNPTVDAWIYDEENGTYTYTYGNSNNPVAPLLLKNTTTTALEDIKTVYVNASLTGSAEESSIEMAIGSNISTDGWRSTKSNKLSVGSTISMFFTSDIGFSDVIQVQCWNGIPDNAVITVSDVCFDTELKTDGYWMDNRDGSYTFNTGDKTHADWGADAINFQLPTNGIENINIKGAYLKMSVTGTNAFADVNGALGYGDGISTQWVNGNMFFFGNGGESYVYIPTPNGTAWGVTLMIWNATTDTSITVSDIGFITETNAYGVWSEMEDGTYCYTQPDFAQSTALPTIPLTTDITDFSHIKKVEVDIVSTGAAEYSVKAVTSTNEYAEWGEGYSDGVETTICWTLSEGEILQEPATFKLNNITAGTSVTVKGWRYVADTLTLQDESVSLDAEGDVITFTQGVDYTEEDIQNYPYLHIQYSGTQEQFDNMPDSYSDWMTHITLRYGEDATYTYDIGLKDLLADTIYNFKDYVYNDGAYPTSIEISYNYGSMTIDSVSLTNNTAGVWAHDSTNGTYTYKKADGNWVYQLNNYIEIPNVEASAITKVTADVAVSNTSDGTFWDCNISANDNSETPVYTSNSTVKNDNGTSGTLTIESDNGFMYYPSLFALDGNVGTVFTVSNVGYYTSDSAYGVWEELEDGTYSYTQPTYNQANGIPTIPLTTDITDFSDIRKVEVDVVSTGATTFSIKSTTSTNPWAQWGEGYSDAVETTVCWTLAEGEVLEEAASFTLNDITANTNVIVKGWRYVAEETTTDDIILLDEPVFINADGEPIILTKDVDFDEDIIATHPYLCVEYSLTQEQIDAQNSAVAGFEIEVSCDGGCYGYNIGLAGEAPSCLKMSLDDHRLLDLIKIYYDNERLVTIDKIYLTADNSGLWIYDSSNETYTYTVSEKDYITSCDDAQIDISVIDNDPSEIRKITADVSVYCETGEVTDWDVSFDGISVTKNEDGVSGTITFIADSEMIAAPYISHGGNLPAGTVITISNVVITTDDIVLLDEETALDEDGEVITFTLGTDYTEDDIANNPYLYIQHSTTQEQVDSRPDAEAWNMTHVTLKYSDGSEAVSYLGTQSEYQSINTIINNKRPLESNGLYPTSIEIGYNEGPMTINSISLTDNTIGVWVYDSENGTYTYKNGNGEWSQFNNGIDISSIDGDAADIRKITADVSVTGENVDDSTWWDCWLMSNVYDADRSWLYYETDRNGCIGTLTAETKYGFMYAPQLSAMGGYAGTVFTVSNVCITTCEDVVLLNQQTALDEDGEVITFTLGTDYTEDDIADHPYLYIQHSTTQEQVDSRPDPEAWNMTYVSLKYSDGSEIKKYFGTVAEHQSVDNIINFKYQLENNGLYPTSIEIGYHEGPMNIDSIVFTDSTVGVWIYDKENGTYTLETGEGEWSRHNCYIDISDFGNATDIRTISADVSIDGNGIDYMWWQFVISGTLNDGENSWVDYQLNGDGFGNLGTYSVSNDYGFVDAPMLNIWGGGIGTVFTVSNIIFSADDPVYYNQWHCNVDDGSYVYARDYTNLDNNDGTDTSFTAIADLGGISGVTAVSMDVTADNDTVVGIRYQNESGEWIRKTYPIQNASRSITYILPETAASDIYVYAAYCTGGGSITVENIELHTSEVTAPETNKWIDNGDGSYTYHIPETGIPEDVETFRLPAFDGNIAAVKTVKLKFKVDGSAAGGYLDGLDNGINLTSQKSCDPTEYAWNVRNMLICEPVFTPSWGADSIITISDIEYITDEPTPYYTKGIRIDNDVEINLGDYEKWLDYSIEDKTDDLYTYYESVEITVHLDRDMDSDTVVEVYSVDPQNWNTSDWTQLIRNEFMANPDYAWASSNFTFRVSSDEFYQLCQDGCIRITGTNATITAVFITPYVSEDTWTISDDGTYSITAPPLGLYNSTNFLSTYNAPEGAKAFSAKLTTDGGYAEIGTSESVTWQWTGYFTKDTIDVKYNIGEYDCTLVMYCADPNTTVTVSDITWHYEELDMLPVGEWTDNGDGSYTYRNVNSWTLPEYDTSITLPTPDDMYAVDSIKFKLRIDGRGAITLDCGLFGDDGVEQLQYIEGHYSLVHQYNLKINNRMTEPVTIDFSWLSPDAYVTIYDIEYTYDENPAMTGGWAVYDLNEHIFNNYDYSTSIHAYWIDENGFSDNISTLRLFVKDVKDNAHVKLSLCDVTYGGYHTISETDIPAGAEYIDIPLYYQTSRVLDDDYIRIEGTDFTLYYAVILDTTNEWVKSENNGITYFHYAGGEVAEKTFKLPEYNGDYSDVTAVTVTYEVMSGSASVGMEALIGSEYEWQKSGGLNCTNTVTIKSYGVMTEAPTFYFINATAGTTIVVKDVKYYTEYVYPSAISEQNNYRLYNGIHTFGRGHTDLDYEPEYGKYTENGTLRVWLTDANENTSLYAYYEKHNATTSSSDFMPIGLFSGCVYPEEGTDMCYIDITLTDEQFADLFTREENIYKHLYIYGENGTIFNINLVYEPLEGDLNIKTQVSGGKITFTWDAIDAAEKYIIAQYPTGDHRPFAIDVAETTDTTYTFQNSWEPGEYYFAIMGFKDMVYSDPDVNTVKVIVTKDITPKNVKAAAESGKITITWDAVDGATSYRVYRANTATGAKKLLKAVTTTTYTDDTAEIGSKYYYFVAAYNNTTGELSDYSEAVEAEILALGVPAITSVDTSARKITLTWEPVTNATSYRVYRANTATGAKKLLKAVTTTSYTDDTAEIGCKYYYFVAAYNTNTGELSEYSNAVEAEIAALAAPVISSISSSNGCVTLTWNEVTGATSYRVYRANTATGTKKMLKAVATTTYTDNTAVLDETYYYFVAAYNSSTTELSDYSEGKSVTVISLAAPAIETISSSDGKVTLTWNAIADATSYRVYRANSETGAKTLLKAVGTTSYTDTTAAVGSTYYYFVAAYNSGTGELSAYSDAASVKVSALAAPAIETISSSGGKVVLTWNAIADATSYRVYRANSENGTKSLLKAVGTTSYTDTTAAVGSTYYYFVAAYNSKTSELSAYSDAVSVKVSALAAPAIETISSSGGKVVLTWNAITNATSYRVYRANSENGTKSLLKAVGTTSYTDTTAAVGSTYYYFIAAYNSGTGELSAYSDAASVKVSALEAPAIETVSSSDGKVTLTWNAITNATSYRVYRANSETGAKSLLKAVGTTSYTDTTAAVGSTYYYFVAAYNSGTGELSAYSDAVSVKVSALAAPAIETISSSDGKVTLTWNAIADATSYRVYRANSATGAKSLLKAVGTTSYTDTTAAVGSTYYYFVAAYNSKTSELSAYSDAVSVKVSALAAPAIETISSSDGMVTLTWNAIADATSYRVNRANSATGAKALLKAVGTTSYTDTTAAVGSTYYYFVAAYNSKTSELSAYSDAASVKVSALTAPNIETATSQGGKVTLTWNAIEDATSYRVYRASSATGAKTLLKAVGTTTYTDDTVAQGETYYYFVAAYNSATSERSAYSDAVSVKVSAIDAPEIETIDAADGKVTLTWNDIADATSYRVYRANSATGAKALLKAVGTTSYTDDTVAQGETYYYFVAAYNSKTGELSAYSSYMMINA